MDSEQPSLLITGNSSGLGRGLTEHYLQQGWRVYGCSRRGCLGLFGDLHDLRCDLAAFDTLSSALEELLGNGIRLPLNVSGITKIQYQRGKVMNRSDR